MATASLLYASVGSLGSGASIASGSFTPATDDVLVVFVQATATVAAGALTGSGGITFTRVFSQTAGASGTGYCFIGDSAAAASSQTVTFDCTGDDCTESGIHVYAVAGQSVYGSSAVVQSKTRQTSTTPTLTMDAAPNTANVLIGAVFSQDGTLPICTEPSSWTEGAETDLGGNGMESCFVNGGYTTNPIVWGSNPGGGAQNGYGVIELQATLPAGQPTVKRFGGVPFQSMNRGVW